MILHEGLWKWGSSHEIELQIQWGKSSPLCKYMRTIYASLLSYRGIFSASGKRKGRKPSCPNGSIQSDMLGWYLAVMVSFSHTTQLPAKNRPKIFSELVKQLGTQKLNEDSCIQSLREEQERTNLPMSQCANACITSPMIHSVCSSIDYLHTHLASHRNNWPYRLR